MREYQRATRQQFSTADDRRSPTVACQAGREHAPAQHQKLTTTPRSSDDKCYKNPPLVLKGIASVVQVRMGSGGPHKVSLKNEIGKSTPSTTAHPSSLFCLCSALIDYIMFICTSSQYTHLKASLDYTTSSLASSPSLSLLPCSSRNFTKNACTSAADGRCLGSTCQHCRRTC